MTLVLSKRLSEVKKLTLLLLFTDQVEVLDVTKEILFKAFLSKAKDNDHGKSEIMV